MVSEVGKKKQMNCANFPMDGDNRVYHMGVKEGDLAANLICVGDQRRAMMLASMLDQVDAKQINNENYTQFLNYEKNGLKVITSSRQFTSVTGTFNGVPVSIVAIGMGVPMMDFFVREMKAVVKAPEIKVIRFGSCGSLNKLAKAGDLSIAATSALLLRNPNITRDCTRKCLGKIEDNCAYCLSDEVSADAELTLALEEELKKFVKPEIDSNIWKGVDITADSFYSSQGRIDPSFCDQNDGLTEQIVEKVANVQSLQMETFQLLHMAKCANPEFGKIKAAAFAMIFANRVADSWISPQILERLEPLCARAVLHAITK